MQQSFSTSIPQLKYRGATYALQFYSHSDRSIAATDSLTTGVRIPTGFRHLLYRGKSYLIPCY